MTPCRWEVLSERHGVTPQQDFKYRTAKQILYKISSVESNIKQTVLKIDVLGQQQSVYLPLSAEVRNAWRYASIRTYTLMAPCLSKL
jgi:hypothetical protein